MNKKRILTAVLSTAMLLSTASGCSSSSTGNTSTTAAASSAGSTGGASSVSASVTSTASDAPIEIVYWHSMGGSGGEAVEKFVEDFNASQSQIHVTAEYQGAYDDAITKLKSAAAGGAGPNIMQLYEIGSRWMIDSGYAVVMQDYIDADGYDLSVLEPNVLAFYTIDGKLQSMPFNSSTPILYYNKDMFEAAGLDPEKAPANWAELEEYCKKLTKTENGQTIYGATFQIYGWFFEQYMSKEGVYYANNENGRAALATAVEFDQNGVGLAFFEKWKDLVDKGLMGNMGRDGTSINNSFIAGQTAMIMNSTAGLPTILKGVNGAFEVGTAFIPGLSENSTGGVSIGGASNWLMNKGDDATKLAAFQFLKYVTEPEQQLYWHEQTGYFPINTKVYELDGMKAHLEQLPQFQTAIDQLHASSPKSCGALLGIFPEARQIIEQNWEEMLAGAMTPQQVVDKCASEINASIEQYNIANS